MRAADSDLTAAARIRSAAMRLFGERRLAAASIRDIAAEAGVSSSLVVHHFKTKEALKAAVDASAVEMLIDALTGLTADSAGMDAAMHSVAELLRDEPALMAYLRRMLIDGGDAASALFSLLVDATTTALEAMERNGVVAPSADARTRAVFLLVNDLGAIIMRDLITQATGIDPLNGPGLQAWADALLEVYTRGVFVTPPDDEREES